MRPFLQAFLLVCTINLYNAQASAWVLPSAKSASIVRPQTVPLPCLRPNDNPKRQHEEVLGRILEHSKQAWKTSVIAMTLSTAFLFSPCNAAAVVDDLILVMPPPSSMVYSDPFGKRLEELYAASREPAFLISDDDGESAKGRIFGVGSRQQTAELYPTLEEVWTLIDKYYIDRTFGGQYDWKKVREKYLYLVSKAKTEEAKFNVVGEMVATLNDKYSRTLDKTQYAAIQKYDLIGVGVTLMPDADKNIVVGAPPIPGSEAARVGMREGDYVMAINGISTNGRTAFDIIDQISQDPSAKSVTMTTRVKGSDTSETGKLLVMARTFEEVRDPIRYKITETRSDGTKVGLVKILEFNALVKGNLETALRELEAAGANAYVIDIRQNRGGAFQSAVEISSLFTENRVATYVVDGTKDKIPFRTAQGQMAIDATDPMVIWIDGKSASASEVLAGSLHDNCRAVLMGENSFGKGLIQAVYGLKNGAGLVLTVARYVTPSGSDIQGVGITPDLGTRDIPFGILGLGTDTSKIDFNDIRNRLSQCRIPDEIR